MQLSFGRLQSGDRDLTLCLLPDASQLGRQARDSASRATSDARGERSVALGKCRSSKRRNLTRPDSGSNELSG